MTETDTDTDARRFVEQRLAAIERYEAEGLSLDAALRLVEVQIPDVDAARSPADLVRPGRSWTPVDIGAVLDGSYVVPEPTVGHRLDGVGLFYRGRVHEIASEPEAGKSWLGLLASSQEIADEHRVVYLDFEDDEGGIVGRLMAMSTDPETVRENFAYVRPTTAVLAEHNLDDVRELLSLRPSLVIIDGVTEAMALHGLELTDNTDVSTFDRLLARRIADHESKPAVVKLDHVTKDRESRGRYSIGGQHKLAGLNGAAFRLENRKPFGIGVTGRSSVFIAKDRPGQLRRHAVPASGGLSWFADLSVESLADTAVDVALTPPEVTNETFRPTELMRRVSEALATAGRPLSGRDITDRVRGKRVADVRTALALLVDEKYVEVSTGPSNARMHTLTRPFGDDQ